MHDQEPKVHRDLGRHDAQIESLERRVETMEGKLDQVLSILSEAKGGWKTLALIAGVAGAMGALAAKFAGIWSVLKP